MEMHYIDLWTYLNKPFHSTCLLRYPLPPVGIEKEISGMESVNRLMPGGNKKVTDT